MFRGVNEVNEVLLGVIECIFALLILHFAKIQDHNYPRPQFWFNDLAKEMENPVGSVGL